jgi:trimeric autotransporter adhesin
MIPVARRLRRGREEGGAVIVIVAVMLVVFLAASAYSIDLAGGRQSETKAQSVADASATAAADVIDPNATPTDPKSTDSSTVSNTAMSLAIQNGACATCVTVNYPYQNDYTLVQVIVRADSAGTVGGEFSRSSLPVAASAVAAEKNKTVQVVTTGSSTITNSTVGTSTTYSTSTSFQYTTNTSTSVSFASDSALFAMDTSCGSGAGLTATGNNNFQIDGATWSNGAISATGSNINFNGPVTYNSRCSDPGIAKEQRTSATQTTWPQDYTLTSVCPHMQSSNITISGEQNTTVNGIYCTTGNITISGNSNITGTATFVGKSIKVENNSNFDINPAYQDLTLYQTGSGNLLVDINSNWLGGTTFCPNGTVTFQSNSNVNGNGFVEAKDIVISSNSNVDIAGTGAGGTPSTSTLTSTITNSSSTVITSRTPTTVTNYTPTTSTGVVIQTSSDGSALKQ